MNKKGIALYFVLAILLVVVILANIILTFITSQTRLTSHQVKRIQAYYAAQAGMNYALEMLRTNDPAWDDPTAFSKKMCRDAATGGCDYVENAFPRTINYVDINVGAIDPVNQTRKINTTVNYTGSY